MIITFFSANSVELSCGIFDIYLPSGMPKSMTAFSVSMHPF